MAARSAAGVFTSHVHQLVPTSTPYNGRPGWSCDVCGEHSNGVSWHCGTCKFDAHERCRGASRGGASSAASPRDSSGLTQRDFLGLLIALGETKNGGGGGSERRSDGVRVSQGDDKSVTGKWYCGRPVMGSYGDGNCGPNNGRNCAECHAFTQAKHSRSRSSFSIHHKHELTVTFVSNHRCDLCRASLSKSWRCSSCDFDCCESCIQKETFEYKGHPHLLRWTEHSSSSRFCDVCRESSLKASFQCLGCNHDVCNNCFARKVALPPPPPPPALSRPAPAHAVAVPTLSASAPSVMTLWHGTSKTNARSIKATAFRLSSRGLLGAGIYFAEQDKAVRFAQDVQRRGLGTLPGAVLECRVTLRRCKYITGDDTAGSWAGEGFDSCFSLSTSASSNPEWVVRSVGQIEIVAIHDV